MARVALEDWQEQIRDPKIECMSRDEMTALQSERLVRQVKNVYENVAFYRKKMDDMGVEPGDIKGIEDIGKLPFTTNDFTEMKGLNFGKDAYEIIQEVFADYAYPICFGFPAGHAENNFPLIIGSTIEMEISATGTTIHFQND